MRSLRQRLLYRIALAGLALPTAILRAQPPPDSAEQQRVLKSAAEFSRDYIRRLPDFTCRRITTHQRRRPESPNWQFQVKVAQELSYYGREEHYQIVEINDAPRKKLPMSVTGEGFISTNGNFGWMLEQLFDPASRTAFQWKNWE